MRPNPIRQKLARGEQVMGMVHFTASPMIVEVMASAGLDFFIIDFEHSPIDIGMAAHLVRAGDAAGIAPLLRIPDDDAGLVKKVLNLGVQGIVLPHGTRESCAELLNAVRYEPDCGLAWYNLGVVLEDAERSDDALPCYESAVRADDTLADAHWNLSLLYERRGRRQEAIRNLAI